VRPVEFHNPGAWSGWATSASKTNYSAWVTARCVHDPPETQTARYTTSPGAPPFTPPGGVPRTQASTKLAGDFFHVDCVLTLQRRYAFLVLEVGSRDVHIFCITADPDG
jgi:hypothetical protein